MNKVLLTGASGFIGRHCIEPLIARGYEVHAVSSRNPASQQGVHWHRCNLLAPAETEALIREVSPSHLLHLAWYVVPGKLISAPENLAWVTASLDLCGQFSTHGGRRALVAGSGYEYDWAYGYCTEGVTPTTPNTVYGASKLALKLMLESTAEQRKLSLAWGRVFFLYGPGEHPDRLVSSVIRSVLKGEPARCSHGRQIRDYLHVQDVADGLVAVLDSELTGSVNVCSGAATTLRDIVTTAGRLMNRPDLILLGAIPARANDTPLVVGHNARLRESLSWTPHYDLESGLQQTIDWWQSQGPLNT